MSFIKNLCDKLRCLSFGRNNSTQIDRSFGRDSNSPSFGKLACNFYLESLLRMALVLINTSMISHINPLLMASTSAANMIFMLCATLFSLTSSSSCVLIATCLGAKKFHAAQISFYHALSFNGLFGALALSAVLVFKEQFLQILNTPIDTLQNSLEYLRFMSYVIFIDALSYVFSACLRARGCAFSINVCVICMNVLTVILNAGFLYGYFGFAQLGLMGVGISNLCARVLGLCAYVGIFLYVLKLKFLPIYLIKISPRILRKLFYIGGFNAAGNLISSLQYICIFSLIAKLGSQYLALQTIYYQLCFFVFSAASSIAAANAIICSHLLGAKKPTEAYLNTIKSCKIAFMASLLLIILVILLKPLIEQLLSFNLQMRQIASHLLILSLFAEPLRALNLVFKATFNAAADVKFNFILSTCGNWLIGFVLAYLLGAKYLLMGIWLGLYADELFELCFNIWRFKSKAFLNRRII